MRKKPEVGQVVYSLNIGNAARGCEQKLTPLEVVKVGRKFFYCGKRLIKFEIDTWRQVCDYSATHGLYETEKEWADKHKQKGLYQKIKEHYFSGYSGINISLDKLERINAILQED